MRPNLLNPLFAALTTLSGVGPKLEKLYRRLLGRDEEEARIIDLLFHLPTGAIDRRARPKLRDVVPGTVVTVAVTVDRHRPSPPHRPRAPYQIYASDETGDLILTFFNARRDYLEKLLPVGELRYVSGTTALYDDMLQMVHPDRVVDEAGLAQLPLVEPVYPLTEGLSLNQVRKAVDAALPKLPDLPEWQDRPGWRASAIRHLPMRCRTLHRPASPADLSPESHAWTRLAYDELLAGQLALALVRAHLRRPAGRATPGTGALRKKLIEALPYSLTTLADARGRRHRRRSRQARAHAAAAAGRRRLRQDRGGAAGRRDRDRRRPAGGADGADRNPGAPASSPPSRRSPPAAGIEVAILTGRERGRERSEILERLRSASIHILVGTHALFQDDVEFRDLGARDRRRAASLRRAPAPGARQEGRGRRHAGDDRDADPAHAGADLFRRHGHFRAAREAGRPPADRHPHAPARPARRGGRRRRPRARGGPARLLGLSAGRGIGEHRSRRRRGSLRRAQDANSANRSTSCMAA